MAVQNSFIDLIAINSFIHLNAIFFTFAVTRQSENSKYKYSFYGFGNAAMLEQYILALYNRKVKTSMQKSALCLKQKILYRRHYLNHWV